MSRVWLLLSIALLLCLLAVGSVTGSGTTPAAHAQDVTGAQIAHAVQQAAGGATTHDDPGSGKLLINGDTITPAGKQTNLGDLPVTAVLSPDGSHLLVENSGTGVQSVQVVSTKNSHVKQTIPYIAPKDANTLESVFVGLAYSPDGTRAYASGGGSDVVHTYTVDSIGKLTPTGDVVIGTTTDNPFPTGLSISQDGSTLYVANNLANTVSFVDAASTSVTGSVSVGSHPYTTAVDPRTGNIFVSNWGDGTLSVIDRTTRKVTGTIAVGQHPSSMVFANGMLYVSDSDSDAVSVVNPTTESEVRRLSTGPTSTAPLSSSPQGLDVSRDGTRLYVANAGNNDVAVFSLDERASQDNFLGFIPTAWYPTDVVVSRNGDKLFITNGYGEGEGPNNTGYYPDPARTSVPFRDVFDGYVDQYCMCTYDKYTGTMNVGTLSTVTVPETKGGGDASLKQYTNEVIRNNHYFDPANLQRSPDNPIPVPSGTSPIKHVIYIIKENRTYDQVFGDVGYGNGSPGLTLFPRANTPNEHALADRFGLLDSFYADSQVSADGHNWVMSANANDYVERMWPQDYAAGPGRNRGYDFEGGSLIQLSPGGYLWDAAAKAGITYRDYGEFVNTSITGSFIPASQAHTCSGPVAFNYYRPGVVIPPGQVLCFAPSFVNPTTTPNLVNHFDPKYRPFRHGVSGPRPGDRMAARVQPVRAKQQPAPARARSPAFRPYRRHSARLPHPAGHGGGQRSGPGADRGYRQP
jgi:YVTN family beta-propeller protein